MDSLEKTGSRMYRPIRESHLGTNMSFCIQSTLEWYSIPEIWMMGWQWGKVIKDLTYGQLSGFFSWLYTIQDLPVHWEPEATWKGWRLTAEAQRRNRDTHLYSNLRLTDDWHVSFHYRPIIQAVHWKCQQCTFKEHQHFIQNMNRWKFTRWIKQSKYGYTWRPTT